MIGMSTFDSDMKIYGWQRTDAVEVREDTIKPEKDLLREIAHRYFNRDTKGFIKRNLILIVLLVTAIIWTFVVRAISYHNAYQKASEEYAAYYAAELEAYKAQQAEEIQKTYFLSGQASLDAEINRAIDSVAPVIAKLSTDAQKYTETCCMLARVMNKYYPGTFAEVAAQPQQWMFYDGSDNTCSQRDKEIAESIIRPYMEQGIVPNGLTAEMVYGEWTPTDFILRDSYQTTSRMHTWRYQG